jgi:hypothetical protein
MATLGTVVSTTPVTDTGRRSFINPLRALCRRAYAANSASLHRSGADTMAAEGSSGGGIGKGHRVRQLAVRGRKTGASTQRRSEVPG